MSKKLGLLERAKRRVKSDGLGDLTHRAKNNITKKAKESRFLRSFFTPRLDNASVEITNDCNLHCLVCTGNARREKGIGIRYIEPDFFRCIIDQLAKFHASVQLNFGGESLMHPDFPKMLKYACDARKRGLGFISWFDNAMLFTPDVSRYVVEYGANRVIFSVDALEEKNTKFRVGTDYQTIKKHIQSLCDIRGKNRFPEIWINKIDLETPKDTRKFIHEWASIVDVIQVSPLQDSLHQTMNREKYYSQPVKHVSHCPFYFFYMGILTDGRIAACCADDDCDTKMGNAQKHTLKQIWNSSRYRTMRKQALANSFSGMPCSKCNFWQTKFQPSVSRFKLGDLNMEVVYADHKLYRRIEA